jgi:hypothetical protein
MTATSLPPAMPGTALTPADLERLAKGGIPPELAEAAILRRVPSHEGAALVGRNGSGDYAGIVFPYQWPGESHIREYRLRRDKPELEAKPDGALKERTKYLSPPGRGNMLYFVPGTHAQWLTDTGLPLVTPPRERSLMRGAGVLKQKSPHAPEREDGGF